MIENNHMTVGEYEVFYESKKAPGITLYSGSKKVLAYDDNEAIDRAYLSLKQTFSQRTKGCWEFYKVVRIA